MWLFLTQRIPAGIYGQVKKVLSKKLDGDLLESKKLQITSLFPLSILLTYLISYISSLNVPNLNILVDFKELKFTHVDRCSGNQSTGLTALIAQISLSEC